MASAIEHLWKLILPGRQIDPDELASTLGALPSHEKPDFRTTVLIGESLKALERHWGPNRYAQWLESSPRCAIFENAVAADAGRTGFPSLESRLMEPTRPEVVLQMLRELGIRLRTPTRIQIGGSVAMILAGYLSRMTDDIDVVDEIPDKLRSQHELLDELASRYSLRLTPFRSHFLPAGWDSRLRRLDRYGQLEVMLVDACDIFVGKLFSARVKDRDDLRAMSAKFEKAVLVKRLNEFAGAMLGEPALAENARQNWFILYGENLPLG